MMRICLRNVDFPLSPAPRRRILTSRRTALLSRASIASISRLLRRASRSCAASLSRLLSLLLPGSRLASAGRRQRLRERTTPDMSRKKVYRNFRGEMFIIGAPVRVGNASVRLHPGYEQCDSRREWKFTFRRSGRYLVSLWQTSRVHLGPAVPSTAKKETPPTPQSEQRREEAEKRSKKVQNF